MRSSAALLVSILAVAACTSPDTPSPSTPATPAPRTLRLQAEQALRRHEIGAAPVLSLVIDDLGEQHDAGARALMLPGPVAYAFLPGTPFVAQEAEAAHRGGHEVLLHLPMEHAGGKLYPLGLTQTTPREELARRFAAALATVPHASGVNNHQGSLLTERREPMIWLMNEIRVHDGLYFVDSRTSVRSVAYEVALQMGIPAARREVFLDAVRTPAAIRSAWQTALAIARKHGTALAIAHPYPETLELLETELPRLKTGDVRLVPPSELIRLRSPERPRAPSPLKISSALTLARPTTGPAGPVPTTAPAAGATAGPR